MGRGTARGRAVLFPGSSFDPLSLRPFALSFLKNQLGRELKLPRVEHRSWSSEILVRRRRNKKLRGRLPYFSRDRESRTGHLSPLDGDRGRIFIARWNSPAKDRRAVDAE